MRICIHLCRQKEVVCTRVSPGDLLALLPGDRLGHLVALLLGDLVALLPGDLLGDLEEKFWTFLL